MITLRTKYADADADYTSQRSILTHSRTLRERREMFYIFIAKCLRAMQNLDLFADLSIPRRLLKLKSAPRLALPAFFRIMFLSADLAASLSTYETDAVHSPPTINSSPAKTVREGEVWSKIPRAEYAPTGQGFDRDRLHLREPSCLI